MFRDVSIFRKWFVICCLHQNFQQLTRWLSNWGQHLVSLSVMTASFVETDSFQVSTIRFPYFFMTFGSLNLCQLPVGAGWKVEGGLLWLETGDLQISMFLSWVELMTFDDMSDAWFEPYSTAIHTDRGKTQAWANSMEIKFEHEVTIRSNPSSNKWGMQHTFNLCSTDHLVPTDGTWMFDIVSLSLQFLCFRFDRNIWWQLMTYIILHPFMKLSTGVILVRSTQGAKVTVIAISSISSFEWRPFV